MMEPMDKKQPRPETLQGRTHKIKVAMGDHTYNLFLTINEHEGRLFEIFVRVGKGGDGTAGFCEAIARAVNLALRYKVPVEEIILALEGIGGAGQITPSVPHAISETLKGVAHG